MKEGIIAALKENKKVKIFFSNEKAISFNYLVSEGNGPDHIVLKNTHVKEDFHINLKLVTFVRID